MAIQGKHVSSSTYIYIYTSEKPALWVDFQTTLVGCDHKNVYFVHVSILVMYIHLFFVYYYIFNFDLSYSIYNFFCLFTSLWFYPFFLLNVVYGYVILY